MPVIKRKFHCEGCGRERTFHRSQFNHAGHAVLTCCTAGLWSISWLSAVVGHTFQPWTCGCCRHKQRAPKALPQW
ncbi:MAG TPA: hypothetical protein VHY22_14445 [Chthoniobacteraceae bacterium]|nr:hypothetical protein [Chthoniobacteraceae bacterium]